MSVDSTAELLRCLQAGLVAPSDLLALGRLKALLLLRDTEGLREALDALPGRCALPPGTWPPARLPSPRVARAGPEHLRGADRQVTLRRMSEVPQVTWRDAGMSAVLGVCPQNLV